MQITKMNGPTILWRFTKQLIFIVALFAVFAVLIGTGVINDYVGKVIFTTASITVIAALGLSLITGMTGQLMLGQAGYMAIGAYATAVLSKTHTPLFPEGMPIIMALIMGASFAGVVGLLFGSLALRLRGDYFAIVTLGFGEVIVAVLKNLDTVTGGASGLMGIPNISVPSSDTQVVTAVRFLWVALFMVLAILAVVHLLTSSHGRAILSVRDNEIAAEAMGINVYYTKLYVFTFSAILAGLAGGLWAGHYKYLSPDSFTWLKSMDLLIIVVLGGLGSFTGTVAAAFAIAVLNELLKFLPAVNLFGANLELKDARLVIYPFLLIIMMIFRPQGLLGTKELILTDTLLSWAWWKKQILRFVAWCKRVWAWIVRTAKRFWAWLVRLCKKLFGKKGGEAK